MVPVQELRTPKDGPCFVGPEAGRGGASGLSSAVLIFLGGDEVTGHY